jgi:large subunit ribosomal protein L10
MKNQKKINQREDVATYLSSAGNFAFVKFEKTTHIALEGLRKELRKAGATIKVVKNTILSKAVNKLASEKEYSDLKSIQKQVKELRENTAVVSLGKDWSTGMNAFAGVAKNDKSITFKLGFLDKKGYDAVAMDKISKLPSRNELIAKIIGSMKSPTSRFVRAIKFPTQKFVMVLNEKVKKG